MVGKPVVLPSSLSVLEALGRVLRLVSVGSKRYLTTKVSIINKTTCNIINGNCSGVTILSIQESNKVEEEKWLIQYFDHNV